MNSLLINFSVPICEVHLAKFWEISWKKPRKCGLLFFILHGATISTATIMSAPPSRGRGRGGRGAQPAKVCPRTKPHAHAHTPHTRMRTQSLHQLIHAQNTIHTCTHVTCHMHTCTHTRTQGKNVFPRKESALAFQFDKESAQWLPIPVTTHR